MYRKKERRGYALLEYCAGSAIVAVILWAALQGLGNNLSTLLGSIGSWASARATEVQN